MSNSYDFSAVRSAEFRAKVISDAAMDSRYIGSARRAHVYEVALLQLREAIAQGQAQARAQRQEEPKPAA